MTNVLVKIYTNDGEMHFRGFHANLAELTMVMSHNLSVMDSELVPNAGGFPRILTHIYLATNVRENPGAFTAEYNKRELRSLSVGDVVSIGEAAWAVEPVGWKKLSTDEFREAIIWDDELNGIPDWAHSQ